MIRIDTLGNINAAVAGYADVARIALAGCRRRRAEGNFTYADNSRILHAGRRCYYTTWEESFAVAQDYRRKALHVLRAVKS